MKLRIFLSWQEETNSQGFDNKTLLIDCVQKALKQIENKGDLKDVFFEFKEGMRDVSGNPSVADTMFDLVDSCNIFVGDMTITQNMMGIIGWLAEKIKKIRKSPNANVCMEYSRALKKHPDFCKQTVLVMNTINGDPKKNDKIIPFDIRGNRFPIRFLLKNKKKDLLKV